MSREHPAGDYAVTSYDELTGGRDGGTYRRIVTILELPTAGAMKERVAVDHIELSVLQTQ